VFHVNWFRQDGDGKFLWPGFGENLRVMKWIVERVAGRAPALDTPIGWMPRAADLDLAGMDVNEPTVQELLNVDVAAWRHEVEDLGAEFAQYGDRLPAELERSRRELLARLGG
jgi:phosphoenolpyruvate carboxykinase (GTP)